jgi:phosphoglycolate phosphatase
MARADRPAIWPEAVVFDLDGTLIDSAADIAAALNGALARRRLPPFPLAKVKEMIGGGVPKLVERALLAHGVSRIGLMPLAIDFLRLYREDLVSRTTIFDGGLSLLEKLKHEGRKLGICTNKQHDLTIEALSRLNLAPFFSAVIGERIGRPRKPDPAPWLVLLVALGVAPGRATIVWDSAADVGCARAAGVPCVLVGHGYSKVPARDLGADIVIERLADLPSAIERLAESRVISEE